MPVSDLDPRRIISLSIVTLKQPNFGMHKFYFENIYTHKYEITDHTLDIDDELNVAEMRE